MEAVQAPLCAALPVQLLIWEMWWLSNLMLRCRKSKPVPRIETDSLEEDCAGAVWYHSEICKFRSREKCCWGEKAGEEEHAQEVQR